MEETQKCSKCKGEIEEGATHTEGSYPGKIKWGKKSSTSFWTRKVNDGKDIVVYRCKYCGYLESYAK